MVRFLTHALEYSAHFDLQTKSGRNRSEIRRVWSSLFTPKITPASADRAIRETPSWRDLVHFGITPNRWCRLRQSPRDRA
jgi:hypothetical protein